MNFFVLVLPACGGGTGFFAVEFRDDLPKTISGKIRRTELRK